jgi:hypothetical protein
VAPLANSFGLAKPGDYDVEVEWTWLHPKYYDAPSGFI